MLSNKLIRSYLFVLEDLLGRNGVNALLNLSRLPDWIDNYPPDEDRHGVTFEIFSRITTAMEDIYGPRMGRNLAHKAAKEAFEKVGKALLTQSMDEFAALPPIEKIESALPIFLQFIYPEALQPGQIERDGEHILLRLQPCPNCAGRKSEEPICQAVAGWLEGLMTVIGEHEGCMIAETACLASGDLNCKYSISSN